ncbi:LarC family nickel insertion protein [Parasutterella muris]|uniref:DUF111 family protein n=1 Tax=Parasutterella muris TaxID=2565572 RepID=A0A6L6YGX6_9BURK|nr:LarC family nickel insertion protein [Parasutterella muris]MVX56950.1 DUF111 family protein [Parasutterella muris]
MNNHQEHHHDHGHEHGHDHCGCGHHHEHSHCRHTRAGAKVLTIRLHSGIAGDMFLCGLMCMLKMNNEQAEEILNGILPALKGSIKLTDKFVNGIRGAHCSVELPHEHEHRNLADVFAIIRNADISDNAKRYAEKAFTLIAEAEGRVHGLPFTQVHFHEVGALDSILDICFTCELYTRLNPDRLIVSPLPIADGSIVCAHGVIPSPAPAVKALLEDVPVRPFLAEGETVTPTGLALLKAFDAEFGPWPAMTVKTIETVYGTYVYEGVPNGATFAFGEELGA